MFARFHRMIALSMCIGLIVISVWVLLACVTSPNFTSAQKWMMAPMLGLMNFGVCTGHLALWFKMRGDDSAQPLMRELYFKSFCMWVSSVASSMWASYIGLLLTG